MKAQFVDVGGLRTRCLVAGQGDAVLLVHPVGYPAEVFARTIAGLEDRFHLIAPDLPGQGFTAPPPTWNRAPQLIMADHVIELTRVLGLSKFSLLGSSLGGLVAALVALRAPERVAKLVLVGTGSVFNEPREQAAVLEQVYANGSRAYADPSLATLRARIANTCHGMPEAEDVLLATMTAYAWPGAREAYRAIIDGLIASIMERDATVFERLEQIRVPTLVVVGANDVRTSFEAHRRGAERMRDARVIQLPACGHLPFLERPGEFNAALAAFLHGESPGQSAPAAAAQRA
ncbi:MAG TPA: alpha/beta fold hydrolase [Casimicrobiaceae bacterium]|nr:alpha/beta fold hydrolase [Casimicrobiaceae bacterium]